MANVPMPGTSVRSPLKGMTQAAISEPEAPKHGSPHGKNPEPAGAQKAKMKKQKKESGKRVRNRGR